MNIQRIRRFAAAAVAAAAALTGTVASAGAAHADAGYTVSRGSTPYWIASTIDSMAVSVADASTTVGQSTRIIQWYNTGGDEQKWYFDGVTNSAGQYVGFLLRNKHSGLCMDTDLYAGDALFQNTCDPNSRPTQIFNNHPNYDAFGILISWRYQNLLTGWWLDVSGRSLNPGTIIDLWYQNYNDNQDFFLTQTS